MFDSKTTRTFILLALVCIASVAIMNLRSIKRTSSSTMLDQSLVSGESAQFDSHDFNSNHSQPTKLKNDHEEMIARRQAEQFELANSRNLDGEFAVQQASHQYRVEWTSEPEKPIKLDLPQPLPVSKFHMPAKKLTPKAPVAQQVAPVKKLTSKAWPSAPAEPVRELAPQTLTAPQIVDLPPKPTQELLDQPHQQNFPIIDFASPSMFGPSLPIETAYPPVQQATLELDSSAPIHVADVGQVEIPERLQSVLLLNRPAADPALESHDEAVNHPINERESLAANTDDEEIRVADNSDNKSITKRVFQPSNERPDNEFRLANASKAEPAKTTAAKTAATKKTAAKKTVKKPAKKPPAKKDKTPRSLVGADNYVLAGQPQTGDHWKDDTPLVDQRAMLIESSTHNFSPDPIDKYMPYDPYAQMQVYEGKTLNSNQRPLVELGRPWYQLGQLSPGYSWFGKHNNVTPQFLVYGDVRTAIASNSSNGDSTSQIAGEINLDFDLKLTGTERFHAFWSPLDNGAQNTRYEFDNDEFVGEFDAQFDFGYFEGDLGAIVGGFTNETLPFDLPFAVGVIPMLVQNGVWMEDAFLGVAATIPARNSPRFSISNMDLTFFAGYDKITSDAFPGDDSAARMYGMLSFIEAMNGYFEIDYAFLDDRTFDDRSYHNIGIGFTRRYGRLISNSTRVIVNAGQNSSQVENTADGVLLLSENSLISSAPSTFVPYANFFAGFDRPQSAARAGGSGGVLRNTGILFESDGMTGYPTLDPTANDTFGAAMGLNIIADDFSQQLVLETAFVGTMGNDATRNAPGNQYGIGFRYQLPLTNAIIFRTDGMYGFMEGQDDVRGLRFELRHKY